VADFLLFPVFVAENPFPLLLGLIHARNALKKVVVVVSQTRFSVSWCSVLGGES
jgi:hypothetical protein